jgi:N-acetylneuraminic acid mutarotase
MAFVVGGAANNGIALSSMERYNASSGQWSKVAAMSTARRYSSACVVAGELYVSGGADGNNHALSSVAKYSPSSDAWSTVAPLPAARSAHCAVTVGSAMYVLGGYDSGAGFASVFKFDSTLETWSHVAPMRAGRWASAACAIGSEIYVFGGSAHDEGQEIVFQDSVFKYDTEADKWSTMACMPHVSSWNSASVMRGLVYIVGTGVSDRDFWRFDPASGAWDMLAPAKEERTGASTFVSSDYLYVVGGGSGTSSAERYDAASDTWTRVTSMSKARRYFGAVVIGSVSPFEEQGLSNSRIAQADGTIVMGQEMALVVSGMAPDGRRTTSMERYDASSGQWSKVAAMSNALSNFGTCVVAGELYVTGGYGDWWYEPLSSVQKYSPTSDAWSTVNPLPSKLAYHAAVAVGLVMYALGGYKNMERAASTSVFKFDSTWNNWSEVAPMPAGRFSFASCAVGSDIYVFGGHDLIMEGQMKNHIGQDSESVFKYDTEANKWSTLAPMPYETSWHSASLMGGLVYIVGAGAEGLLDGRGALRFDPASEVWDTLAPTNMDRMVARHLCWMYTSTRWEVTEVQLWSNTTQQAPHGLGSRACQRAGVTSVQS